MCSSPLRRAKVSACIAYAGATPRRRQSSSRPATLESKCARTLGLKARGNAALAIHLRQICLVARELSPVAKDLKGVFGLKPCHVDRAVGQYGLENTLWPVGTKFLQVAAPLQENTAEGRYLDRGNGDGGCMVITHVPMRQEQDAIRARAAENGVRVAHEVDLGTWKLMQLQPGGMRASFFEVEWDERAEMTGHWMLAGGDGWQAAVCKDAISDILAIDLQPDDPEALAAHWGRVEGLSVERRDGVPVVALANAVLRFVQAEDGRGPGLGAIDIKVEDCARLMQEADARGSRVSSHQMTACGTRFNLIE